MVECTCPSMIMKSGGKNDNYQPNVFVCVSVIGWLMWIISWTGSIGLLIISYFQCSSNYFQRDTLRSCAMECTKREDCRGFSFQKQDGRQEVGGAKCRLTLSDSTTLEPHPGAFYYDMD